jgi:xylulokinase
MDLGTSAIKIGLFDTRGRCVVSSTTEYSLVTTSPLWVECELETYWRAVVSGMQAIVHGLVGRELPEIAGLAVSCQGETLVALDASGAPIRPAIVWLDNRASAEAAALEARFGLEEIYRRTGQLESLPTWTASKILWLRTHEAGGYERTATFLLLEDWLIYRMCGALVGERSLYVTSLLLDWPHGGWWEPMLAEVGLDRSRLVTLVDPGSIVGRLALSPAAELGLPAGIPIVAGGLDQVLAATGAGNIAPGLLTENTGTVLGLAACLAEMPQDRSLGLPMFLHVIPGLYCAQPCGQTAGLVLRWLRDNFFGDVHATDQSTPSYESVIAEAADIAPGANGVTVIPHLAGAQYPEYNTTATCAVIGLSLSEGRGHVTRAVLEAVAFMLRKAVEAMRAAGLEFGEIASLGNSASSDVWTHIKADVCQLPIRRFECREPSLLGAAMLVAQAVGDFSSLSEACSVMVRSVDVTEPDPVKSQIYEQAFSGYNRVYELLYPEAAN